MPRTVEHAPRELLQGTVDVLILKTLNCGEMHGYAISRWLHERTAGVLVLKDAALYQALHRLQEQGLIESEWGASENNRRARFYRLTRTGRARLSSESATWMRYADAVREVLAT